MKKTDWGFNKDHLLQIEMKLDEREPFMENVKKLPMVESFISTSFFTVIESTDQMGATGVVGVEWDGKDKSYNPAFQTFVVESNFVPEIGLQLLEGRNFRDEDFTGRRQAGKIIIPVCHSVIKANYSNYGAGKRHCDRHKIAKISATI